MKRAYALLEVRAADDDKRIIEGIANTNEIDSYNTILEPQGAIFRTPIPVLYQHNSRQPIGHVIEAKASKNDIRVKIQIAKAGVAEFIDEAWALIKNGLVRGLSVGFDPIEEVFDKTFGGYRYPKWKLLELSAVTIAANESATMSSVRSADEAILAALGTKERTSAVRLNLNLAVSGFTKGKAMTIKEHIAALEAKRAANDTKLDEILELVAKENRSRDDAEEETYTTLTRENDRLDKDIKDFQAREKSLALRAVPVTPVAPGKEPEKDGQDQRRGVIITDVRSNAPKGIGMARIAIAMIRANNNPMVAVDYAKKYWPGDQGVELALRAAVEAGDTTTSGWASQLVPAAQQMNDEFLELLRPATIIGRIPGLRRVPFNIAIPVETASGTAAWVGEGAPKPVTKLTLSSVTLRWAKAAAIVVITKELAKFSRPDAELVVRNSMVKTLIRFFDTHFVSATAEVSNVSPAGILNGISSTAVSGATAAAFRTDLNTILAKMTANNVPLGGIVLLMSSTQAVALSLLVTDLGVPLFPFINRDGGTIQGFPVVVSEAVGTKIIAINAEDILLAEDPGVMVDVSDTASVEMDSAPAGGEASPVSDISVLKSFWQNNLIGVRVEQFITWKVARTTAVEYLTATAYKP